MKTILVTGGNRGIGLEICRQLDALGHEVVLGSRSPEKGEEAIRGFNNKINVCQLDIRDEESILNLFNLILQKYGKLDVLINNAALGPLKNSQPASSVVRAKHFIESFIPGLTGIHRRIVPRLLKAGIIENLNGVKNISLDEVKRILDTNLFGAWRMMQVFIPLLEIAEKGRIINISSGSGALNGLNGEYPAYSISKSALNALTIMMANEMRPKKISVNAICPGWVKTDMGGKNAPRSVKEGADTAVWLAIAESIPTGGFFRDRKKIDW